MKHTHRGYQTGWIHKCVFAFLFTSYHIKIQGRYYKMTNLNSIDFLNVSERFYINNQSVEVVFHSIEQGILKYTMHVVGIEISLDEKVEGTTIKLLMIEQRIHISKILNLGTYKIINGFDCDVFTKKQLFDFLVTTEQYFKELFRENAPSLDFAKRKLKNDYWCTDNEIPEFFQVLFELVQDCKFYENIMLDDYSHDYAVISHDSYYMTDGEVRAAHHSIESILKTSERTFEKKKKEIFDFISIMK